MHVNPLRRRKRQAKIPVSISDTVAEYIEEAPKKRPTKRKVAFSVYKAWRVYKRSKKMKNPVTSKTTQNVAIGTLAGGGTILAVLAFLRNAFPDWLPWGTENDEQVGVAISVIVIPLISRLIAFWRNPEKKEQGK